MSIEYNHEVAYFTIPVSEIPLDRIEELNVDLGAHVTAEVNERTGPCEHEMVVDYSLIGFEPSDEEDFKEYFQSIYNYVYRFFGLTSGSA